MFPVVTVEVCVDVVGLSVEAGVKDSVVDDDSMEDVIMAVVGLDTS